MQRMSAEPAAVERLSWLRRLVSRAYASPRLFPAAAWIAGTVFFFHQTLLSGFDRIAGDFADSRLCNYLLEHTFSGWLGVEGTSGCGLLGGHWRPG